MLRADLEAAANAGLISPEQLGPLADFLAGRGGETAAAAPPSPSGEEDLRFIRNFHDVFLSIGIVLVAIGLIVTIMMVLMSDWELLDKGASGRGYGAALLFGAASGAMWLLAEFFARRRRLFLPSIALCVSFTGFFVAMVAAGSFGVVASVWGDNAMPEAAPNLPLVTRATLVLVALSVAAAPLLFYWRFRLPFSLSVVGTGATLVLAALVYLVTPKIILQALYPLALIAGLALFTAGVAFDARDPARTTRLSDNGFWLHMAAAPLILNGALGCLSNVLLGKSVAMGMFAAGGQGPLLAASTLVVVAILGLTSLLINRRALIVSALITTGVAVAALLQAFGMGAGALAAATLLTLGIGVLVLGAGWHGARRTLLKGIPQGAALARIFPPETME